MARGVARYGFGSPVVLISSSTTSWRSSSSQGKAQGRKEVAGEIAEQQVQAHRDASEILAEQRPDRAASDRLRDGSF